jgi:hypothetical protein
MGGDSSSNGVNQPLMTSTDADIYQNIAFPPLDVDRWALR